MTLSPLDNRYLNYTTELHQFFSYESWIKYRVVFEIKYLGFLIQKLQQYQKLNYLSTENIEHINLFLNELLTPESFNSPEIITQILDYERTTHHDIKAIEYWLRSKLNEIPGLSALQKQRIKELVHFGLTSNDVNSVAMSCQWRDFYYLYGEKVNDLMLLMLEVANDFDVTILGHTHGQPAVPTNMKKEFGVFFERIKHLSYQIFEMNHSENNTMKSHKTKLGGAVGNLNAHYAVMPEIDWQMEMDYFIESKYKMSRWRHTTQITNYEDMIYCFQTIVSINNVLIDFCQDIWLYISKHYFILKKENENQVGSSTMPQKVNPIDFENAEGNLKMANSGLHFLIDKLAVSRLQRDLTDSTVLRNVGTYMGHIWLAYQKISNGLKKLEVNQSVIKQDLHSHPEVLGEAVQTILRFYGLPNGYDVIRMASQNKTFVNQEEYKLSVLELVNNTYLHHSIRNNYGLNEEECNTIVEKINNLNVETYVGRV